MRSAMSRIFREEPDVCELIKRKAIYELLETITAKYDGVANVIEGIVFKMEFLRVCLDAVDIHGLHHVGLDSHHFGHNLDCGAGVLAHFANFLTV